jgi:hypothetical protein
MTTMWLVEYSNNFEGQKKLFKQKEDAYKLGFRLYEQDYRERLQGEIYNFGLNPYNPTPEPENLDLYKRGIQYLDDIKNNKDLTWEEKYNKLSEPGIIFRMDTPDDLVCFSSVTMLHHDSPDVFISELVAE